MKKLLIVGCSGDLGFAVLEKLSKDEIHIGAHYYHNKTKLESFSKKEHKAKVKLFRCEASSQKNCAKLVRSYAKWAGGIDGLVQLSGSVDKVQSWDKMTQKNWDRDLAVNLSGPFFLAQEAMKLMKRGGRIIFTSTASAAHGGGRDSIAYGCAKSGIESITKGLARIGAEKNILVNTVAPGFIMTKFHEDQMHRNAKQLKARAELVPLKRAGTPDDVASMITYLLSPKAEFITGEIINISGGDWL